MLVQHPLPLTKLADWQRFSTLFRVSAGATTTYVVLESLNFTVSVPSFGSVLVQPIGVNLPYGTVIEFQYPLSGQCWCNGRLLAVGVGHGDVSVPSFGSVLVQHTGDYSSVTLSACFSTLFRVSAGATGQ